MAIKIIGIAILSYFFVFVESCSGLNNSNEKTVSDSEVQDVEFTANLNASNTVYSQPISPPNDEFRARNFLKVQIVEVSNPKLYPISFEAYYAHNGKEDFLGSFALYPSDNSGDFLIATQGKLKSGGNILLKLILPTTIQKTDTVEITLKQIRFQ